MLSSSSDNFLFDIEQRIMCYLKKNEELIMILTDEPNMRFAKIQKFNDVVCATDIVDVELSTEKFKYLLAMKMIKSKDSDIRSKVETWLRCLKNQGLLFVWEETDDSNLALNQFTTLFEDCPILHNDQWYKLKLLEESSLNSSIQKSKNWRNHFWVLKKCAVKDRKEQSFRVFLDTVRFSIPEIIGCECFYGPNSLSPGTGVTEQIFDKIGLKQGNNVLDIGCGIGYNEFYLAKTFGVNVLGVDYSSNMIKVACDKAQELGDPKVKFMIANMDEFEFPLHSFDLVYSRDAMLYSSNKEHLIKRIFNWLKPGGRCLIVDYMLGHSEMDESTSKYFTDRGYKAISLENYLKYFEDTGFDNIQNVDITNEFVQKVDHLLDKARTTKDEYLLKMPKWVYDDCVTVISTNRQHMENGVLRWAYIQGAKPLDK